VVDIYQRFAAGEPNNTHYREQLALAYAELADTKKVRGSISSATALMESAVSILEEIDKAEPGNITHEKNLRDAISDLSNDYTIEGKANASLVESQRVRAIVAELRLLNLPDAEAKRLENSSHLQIGAALTSLGDYKTAISEIQLGLDGFTRSQSENPNDTSANYSLWAANRRLAIAVELNGDSNKAIEYARRALAIMEDLMATSPRDIGYHRNSAMTRILIGQMLVNRGLYEQGLQHFRRALELSSEVLENDPEYFESKVDLARATGNLGHALILSGKIGPGLLQLRETIRLFEGSSQADSSDAFLMRDYAETCGWLAATLASSSRTESTDYSSRAISLWNELKSRGPLSTADALNLEIAASDRRGLDESPRSSVHRR